MKIGVCITTYRESAGYLVMQLDKMGYSTYVVDAEETGVRLGIGPCLLEAWRRAFSDKCGYILQMDAGNSHFVVDTPRLLNALKLGADMVIGSRFCKGASYIGNPKRATLSRIASAACNLKAHTSFTDWTSGFRGFKYDTLRRLYYFNYQAQMHGWQIEVLKNALRLDADIAEVPIMYHAGRSSFNRKVAFEALGVWWQLKSA